MCHNIPHMCIFKSQNRALTCFHPAHRWVTCWPMLDEGIWREKQKWKMRCCTSDLSPGVQGPSLTLIKTVLICSNLLQPAVTSLPDHVQWKSQQVPLLYSIIRHLISWGKLSAFVLLHLLPLKFSWIESYIIAMQTGFWFY